MPIPLDEFPIHQVPLSMQHVATSDRNVYDRCIYQAMARDGSVQLITGMGVYPNLGVVDAYVAVRAGDVQHVVRASDALGDDRMNQAVGPFRIEVIEPLQRLRLVCDGRGGDTAFDLEWTAAVPPFEEPHHVMRTGNRVIIDACRFAGTGFWSGAVRAGGVEYTVTHDTWSGTRDRSWGIRPTGEPEPPGRSVEHALEGFWWNWVPLRFDDFSLMVIAQEEPDGHRVLSEAIRVWPAATGRGIEQLGWPEIELHYRPGTRHPERAVLHLSGRGKPLDVEIETLGAIALHVGCGYGGDPEWAHGQWRGRDWVERLNYDLRDPTVAGRIPFGVIDHVARATCEGHVGYGIFEHASIGRHDPTGMADYGSVA